MAFTIRVIARGSSPESFGLISSEPSEKSICSSSSRKRTGSDLLLEHRQGSDLRIAERGGQDEVRAQHAGLGFQVTGEVAAAVRVFVVEDSRVLRRDADDRVGRVLGGNDRVGGEREHAGQQPAEEDDRDPAIAQVLERLEPGPALGLAHPASAAAEWKMRGGSTSTGMASGIRGCNRVGVMWSPLPLVGSRGI